MYTKKVLNHFKKPHNYGKMKNPDGMGKVGNIVCGDVMWLYIKIGKNKKGQEIISDIKFETFGCLPQDGIVVTNEGDWEYISSIRNGSFVLNEQGKKTRVLEGSIRKYNGQLLRVIPFVSPYNEFSLTPEHPVFSIKRQWLKSSRKSSKVCNWLKVDEKELLITQPKYILAKDLNISDYLVFVVNKTIKDSSIFTKEVMKLMGYYLAEGYSSANHSVLAFAFNKNEIKNIDEVKSLILKVIRKKVKERIRGNVKEIYICSRKWVKFFTRFAGRLALNKKLSSEIILLPFWKQWEMIKTLIKGDGSLTKRRMDDFPRHRIATASQKLAIQIQEILARDEIFCSIKKFTNIRFRSYIEGRKISANPIFEISFSLKRKHKFVHKNKNYFLVPIREIKKKHYQGDVFNIQVEGQENSYLTKGFVVHNCVAAIATSSTITDLAKGKTLEEALKINKKEVIRSLGQLPPIKIHCSVLAADALSEAIYDYLLKTKKEIPQKLSQRHQRLQKEKEIIEEKYKDWIKTEEKLHSHE